MKQFRIELKGGSIAFIDAGDRETPETWLHHQPKYVRLAGVAYQEVGEIVNVIEVPSKRVSAHSLRADWLPERHRCS